MSCVRCEVRQAARSCYWDENGCYEDESVQVSFLLAELSLPALKNAFPFEGGFSFRLQVKPETIGLTDSSWMWLDITSGINLTSFYRLGEPLVMQAIPDIEVCAGNDLLDVEDFYCQYLEAVERAVPPINYRPERRVVEGQSSQDPAGYSILNKLKNPQASISLKSVKKGASSVWKGALNTFKATATQLQSTIQTLTQQPSSELSDTAEENLSQLSDALSTKFSDVNVEHSDLLRQMWIGLFPGDKGFSRKSNKWKEAGFVNSDPVADLKTTGILAIKAITYLAKTYPTQAQVMLANNRENTKYKYPFGIVGINITMLLAEVLNLRDQKYLSARANYWDLFEAPAAFFELFCQIFFAVDSTWTETGAVRADFGRIIGEAKTHLSAVLQQGPRSLQEYIVLSKQT